MLQKKMPGFCLAFLFLSNLYFISAIRRAAALLNKALNKRTGFIQGAAVIQGNI